MDFYHLYTSLLSVVCSFHSCYQNVCSLLWYLQYSLMEAFIIYCQYVYSTFLWSCLMLITSRVPKRCYNCEACSSSQCEINFDHLGLCSWSQACKCSCFPPLWPWNWNGILKLSSTTSTTSWNDKTNLVLGWTLLPWLWDVLQRNVHVLLLSPLIMILVVISPWLSWTDAMTVIVTCCDGSVSHKTNEWRLWTPRSV